MNDAANLCECPNCGRAHKNLGFGKPPATVEAEKRQEEHYQAAMAMAEKHRKLWVEASQEREQLRSALLQCKQDAEYPDELGDVIDAALAQGSLTRRQA